MGIMFELLVASLLSFMAGVWLTVWTQHHYGKPCRYYGECEV